jgi:putative (di)nucleoside polyphosphate hydrolase
VAGHHFRAGVIAVVRRADGDVMAFERADKPGHWQLPQGGLERGESPVEALWRELEEETGLGPADVELIGEPSEWLIAEWPIEVVGDGARLGQVHRWFELLVRDEAVEPRPDGREFRAWKWVAPAWLVDNVVEFKRPAYRQVLGGEPRASSSERSIRRGG